MQQNNEFSYSNYLSDEAVLSIITEKLDHYKQLLIQAPTGCGKTYTFINHAKTRKGKTIFLVPNVSNVMQIANEYNIPGVHGESMQEGIWTNNNVVVATYDKANAFIKENLDKLMVVLDEAHNLQSQANFRSDAILGVKKLVKKSSEAVFLSATINHLKHELYGEILRFKPENPQNIVGSSKILLSGKNSNKDVAFDLIRKKVVEGKRCLVKMNHKKTLYEFQELLKEEKISSEVLTTDNKADSEVMESIIDEQTLPTNHSIVFCTSLLDAGVNLKEIDVLIDIQNGDPNSIKQFSARPRVKLGEHYVIIKGNVKDKKTENKYTRDKVEEVIASRLKTATTIKTDLENYFQNLEKESREYLRFKFSLVEDSLEEEFFVKVDGEEKFYIDEEAIRNSEYEKYYRSLQVNSELLQKELADYDLPTIIEEYDLGNSGGGNFSKNEEKMTDEEKTENLSQKLKTLESFDAREFTYDCFMAKDQEKYFNSNRIWKMITVDQFLVTTFGMYMALGFPYKLTCELILKSYSSNQKKNKIKNFILAYQYSKKIADTKIYDNVSYKVFKIIYDLYKDKATFEDEKKALIEYIRLLGKRYTKNHLSTRGSEIFQLENKSTKKQGKTIHYKESKGLHTAKSILEFYEITDSKYVEEFQELLDECVQNGELYTSTFVDKDKPENNPNEDIFGNDISDQKATVEKLENESSCELDGTKEIEEEEQLENLEVEDPVT